MTGYTPARGRGRVMRRTRHPEARRAAAVVSAVAARSLLGALNAGPSRHFPFAHLPLLSPTPQPYALTWLALTILFFPRHFSVA